MQDLNEAEKKLIQYNQEHIIDYFKNLNDEEKKNLSKQILEEIDFEQLKNLYENTSKKEKFENSKISPINAIIKEKINPIEKEEFKKLGEDIIKNNQYAVVIMAGGQGTRLGFSGPKGTFKLNIGKNGKYIFEILADTLKKSKELYNILPFWYIMTSNDNNEQTISFFKEHDYFGYEKEKVKFFIQGELPLLTMDGKLVFDEEKNRIKTASNGNGSVYKSLEKSKMIEDMKKNNVKWVYICGVDNIMVKPIDPTFIGLVIKQKKEAASKSIVKEYPDERVGAFCKKDGKLSIVEYNELTEEMRNYRNELGEFVYGEGNFVSHLLSLNAIETIASKKLRYHPAIKKGLYKFESFIFDGFEYLDDMEVYRVKREEEFAPIKNKEGVDSPKTACEIYERSNTWKS